MNQHEAPIHTLITVGHPANGIHCIKNTDGRWVNIQSGTFLDDEDFRGGWDIVRLPGYVPKGVVHQVLVIERVNVITGTRELLDVVRDIEAAADLTMRGVEGWRQGSDRVWSVETERTGVVITATPRDLSL